MKKYIIPALVFLVATASTAFVFWTGGINFDHRDYYTGCAVGMTFFVGLFACVVVGLILSEP